jgi:hydrogenase nickel insertion protein HypA
MHELSFAEQVLDGVLQETEAWPASRITRIKLRAPESLALEPASLRFALEALSADTQAEGAEIIIAEEAGVMLECGNCGSVKAETRAEPVCPHCGAPCRQRGAELVIEEIELDG